MLSLDCQSIPKCTCVRRWPDMSSRLPLSDPRRIKARDDKLWIREKKRARLYNFNRIQCPCTLHRGTGLPFRVEEVERHLYKHGRYADCRTWRGPDDPDSSDEEWEADFTNKILPPSSNTEQRDNDVQVRSMMQDIYQEVDAFITTEDTLNNITAAALETVDGITGLNDDYGEPSDANVASGDNGGHGVGGVDTDKAEHGTREQFNIHAGPPDANSERLEEERVKDAKALEDAMQVLYKDPVHSKLAATIMVVNLVATHTGITEKAADDILATIKCLLPGNDCLPPSMYHAKTLTKRLGLDFKNIDGCLNGCVLFDEENTKSLDRCPRCDAPRYRDMLHRTRPLKVLRQFPVTPRLQRFYRIPVLSKLLRWHSENQSRDGKVRYPADSRAWKRLDTMDPALCNTKDFGEDKRDVRLQVACDGICPFKLHKSTWSAWPVLVSLLNLPPWLVTKKFFTMLTLLIPGKYQVPFEHFDVWIRPLIDELKTLWEGVDAYDVLAPEGCRTFKLRAAVLYTTHDFPGYGTVSGSSHQGYAACPPCGNQLRARYAYESKKLTYRDARRWTRPDHYIRSSRFDSLFDGHPETRLLPVAKKPEEQRAAFLEYQAYLQGIKARSGRRRMPGATPESQPEFDQNTRSNVGDEFKEDNIHSVEQEAGIGQGELSGTPSEFGQGTSSHTQGRRTRFRRRG